MSDNLPVPGGEFLLYTSDDGRVRLSVRVQDGTVWLPQRLIADLFEVSVPDRKRAPRQYLRRGGTRPWGNYSEIPNSSDRGRARGQPPGRSLQPRRHPGGRLPRPVDPGHAVPPVGDDPASGATGQGLRARRRAAQGGTDRSLATTSTNCSNASATSGRRNGGSTRRSPTSTPPASTTTRRPRSRRRSSPPSRTSCTGRSTATPPPRSSSSVPTPPKPHMGLTTWKNAPEGKIRKADVSVAKNYLTEEELRA